MTAPQDFADSHPEPMDAPWPEPVKVTGSMHTPALNPAWAAAWADHLDKEMLAHMTGAPMPGWEVPLHVGIDPGAPEGDRTVLSIRGEVGIVHGASMKPLEETLPQCLRPEGLPDTVWRGEGAHRMGASQSFWDAAEKHPRVIAELERRRAEVQKAASKPVPMLTKQVDRILSNHGRARPPQMPRNLRIYIRPSYPWFHSCGYAVGHARVSPPLKPMRIIALAAQYLALAPTLTHQAST